MRVSASSAASQSTTLQANSRRCGNRTRKLIVVAAVVLCLHLSLAFGQNNVLTQHNDVGRTGQNLNETLLTPANVNAVQFGKLFTQDLDGIAVAQPLYVSNLPMTDGRVHNVVFIATQHNTVYAFDADDNRGTDSAPLWAVSVNDGGTPDPIGDFGCRGTGFSEVGITSTPVIDRDRNVMYVVAKTVTAVGDRQFTLHKLDITTGRESFVGPVPITGSSGTNNFQPVFQLQRPALLLANGLIYIGFGGNGCDIYAYNGWLFAYDENTLRQRAVLEMAPDGKKSSLWQGGTGPSVDEFGNIYVVTANGTYDGPDGDDDFGDSVLKLGWNGNNFGILDYFTPYNQSLLQDEDLDLGSAGALILPDQPGPYPHELVAGGKQGTLYLINRDSLGQFNSTADNVIQSLPGAVPGELTGSPVYWNGSVYVSGDHDYIKQFPLIDGMLTPQPVSQTDVFFGGTGASSTSLTANGTQNGILWALSHSQHILYAFDPTNLERMFYSSKQAPEARDAITHLIRFVTPTISNGKVYIGGKTKLTVFGLLPQLSPSGGDGQTGLPLQVLPTPLTVLAIDAYSHAPVPDIRVTCNDGSAKGRFIPGPTQITDGTGTVSFQYQLPRPEGSVTITCASRTATATAFTETAAPGAPTTIRISSGNKQSGPPDAPLPDGLVVRVVDANGNVVPGVTVNFNDNGAGGKFSAPWSITDSRGLAGTVYTTGPNIGKVVVTAFSNGTTSVNFLEMVQ